MTKRLNEIVVLRPVIIFSIIIGHAFAVYSGAWSNNYNLIMIPAYTWVNPFFISFQLYSFVFISGFLYANQRNRILTTSFFSFSLKKAKRLLLPSLLFGSLFSVILHQFSIQTVLNGYQHLWFLPMLFWCFVFVRGFDCIKNKKIRYTIMVLIYLSLIVLDHFLFLPYGLKNSIRYIPFFILGSIVYVIRHRIKVVSWYKLSFVGALYLAVWFLNYCELSLRMLSLICIVGGVIISLLFAIKVQNNRIIYSTCVKIGKYCFGLYIFHQFFMVLFIGYLSQMNISSYILPFVLFFLSVFCSFFILKVLFRFRIIYNILA